MLLGSPESCDLNFRSVWVMPLITNGQPLGTRVQVLLLQVTVPTRPGMVTVRKHRLRCFHFMTNMRPLCVRRCSCRSTYTIEIDSPSAAFSFDRGAGAAIAFLCPWYPGTVGFLPSWRPRTRVPWYKFEVDRTGLVRSRFFPPRDHFCVHRIFCCSKS